ncbi:MAG: heat-inducible transcriptional repressor HrcA [Rhodospirillales bacterium]|nr:heat-inducible transcriptional repressor HrcA [Rhodospirillales bacterium]
MNTIRELNDRSREIFRLIVDAFMESGEPIGSRTLARRLDLGLSPATIRNVMSDLEEAGLLFAPHTSAGRLPTEAGLRLFVDGLVEIGNVTENERQELESHCVASGKTLDELLDRATTTLSGLSHLTGVVYAPKVESPLRHIEFVYLSPGRALVVIVTENGAVENRVLELPRDLPASTLVEASNYLSARLVGRTLAQALDDIRIELKEHRAQLDTLAERVIEAGLATWTEGDSKGSLIVRGQANLLDNVAAVTDLERIRSLFSALETKETMLKMLTLTDTAKGVRIFIGSDNDLFRVAGCAMIVAPFRNAREHILGAIGVVGPTRMNYARIIPMVDYTAKMVGRILG